MSQLDLFTPTAFHRICEAYPELPWCVIERWLCGRGPAQVYLVRPDAPVETVHAVSVIARRCEGEPVERVWLDVELGEGEMRVMGLEKI